MTKTISCTLMRGGTSKGPILKLDEMPSSIEECSDLLREIMGSGHELQIDGIGGGYSLTSKVAMVGPSSDKNADVDYLFAQVGTRDLKVDFSPNCGNMLSAVGPFAIDNGLVAAQDNITCVRIRNLNTNKIIHAEVKTANGEVVYSGDTVISGVPNSAAPIKLTFFDVAGAKTGKLFPTGKSIDIISGIPVTCIDAATPCVIINANNLGKTGHEQPFELDNDLLFLEKLEKIRLQAGILMGMGDVKDKVIPKPVIVSKPKNDGNICARYFVPHSCHKSLAVTGSIAISASYAMENTVCSNLIQNKNIGDDNEITIEHPSGKIDLSVKIRDGKPESVSLIRTARKILTGTIYLP